MKTGEEKGKKNKKREKKDIEWYNNFLKKIFIEFESFSNWAWKDLNSMDNFSTKQE